MNTVICAEILGPFINSKTIHNSTRDPINVYIEFPDSVTNLSKNVLKVKEYLNDKRRLIRDLNMTIEDEQPICPGIFIITSIIIMDEDMTEFLETNFLGYNVINTNNKLTEYLSDSITKHIHPINTENFRKKNLDMFVTQDGIGFIH